MRNYIVCRINAFETILGRHVLENHLDNILVADIEQIVNREADVPYSQAQVMSVLEVRLERRRNG